MTPQNWLIFPLFVMSLSAHAGDDVFGSLPEDCYQEWKTRGWVIGEDNTPAHEIPLFASGIRRMCDVRARMFADNPDISPYIQGRLAELAPYVFSGTEADMESLILKLDQRRPGHQFSGSFMHD